MQIISRGFRPRRFAALPLLLALGACDAGVLDAPAPPPGEGGQRVLGVVEVTLHGIGSSQMTATARLVRAAGGPSLALLPIRNGDGSGDGTLRLENEFVGSFTHGTRGAGGELYMHAGFRVLNAMEDGTPYDTPRRNLTFLGAATTATIDTTPVREIRRFDGSNASPAIARQVRPTGMVNSSADGVLYADGVDVLQAYMEHEVRAVTPPAGVTSVFPYGFVARGPGGVREIPVGGEGLVTFAFRVPLQPSAIQDPYTVTFSFLAVEDTETRLTQSLEEQTPQGNAAFAARARQLNASPLVLLPGSTFADSALKWRYVCAVRTAGSAASPDEFLLPPQPTVRSSAPNPYSTSNLARNGTVSYVFDRAAPEPTPQSFAVNGSLGGRRFLAGGYTGGGTTRLTTPPGDYFAGELVDVTLTSALTCEPRVARFRAAAGAGSGTFAGDVAPITGKALALADLNHDGNLDLLTVAAAAGASTFAVQLGFGNGTFGAPTTYAGPPFASTIAVADFNGDGNPDVAVMGRSNPNLVIWDGQGDGTLTGQRTIRRGSGPRTLAAADMNADGLPDLVIPNFDNDNVVVADAPDFAAYRAYRTGRRPWGIAVADMDADGRLDAVTADSTGNSVTILRGMGGGVLHRSFTRRISLGTARPVVVAAGDVTRDGIPDVVTGSGPHTVLLVGDGRGGFGTTVPLRTTAGGNIIAVMLGDVDGDGRLDLTAVDRAGNGGYVMLNTAGGLAYHSSFLVNNTPRAAAMGDLNGDARLDVVVTGASNTTVLLGQP